jgi:nitrate reductase assembly molybdenum cofactor insertion protein NarJ
VRDTAPREALQRTVEDKRAAKEALVQQLHTAQLTAASEAAAAAAARRDAVLKLKEQEVHTHYVKVFDATESPGLGLLTEMSLAETRERLAVSSNT